jgi:hypothetical protein
MAVVMTVEHNVRLCSSTNLEELDADERRSGPGRARPARASPAMKATVVGVTNSAPRVKPPLVVAVDVIVDDYHAAGAQVGDGLLHGGQGRGGGRIAQQLERHPRPGRKAPTVADISEFVRFMHRRWPGGPAGHILDASVRNGSGA